MKGKLIQVIALLFFVFLIIGFSLFIAVYIGVPIMAELTNILNVGTFESVYWVIIQVPVSTAIISVILARILYPRYLSKIDVNFKFLGSKK
jgi:hypothetical protein